MIRVWQISGGVGILGVHILLLVLLPHLPPAATTPNGPKEDESKSLWHIMAQSLLAVDLGDRDRFLDLCLKRRVVCNPFRFAGPQPDFKWQEGVTIANKNRFWHAYTCVYNSNLTQCPVDGEWSPWSPWNSCSATCDATGNQTRSRTCSNPVPLRGGERCQGSTMRSRPCLGLCKNASARGGLEGAEEFLKQVHEAYPSLMHDCYNAHCTYGVVQRVIVEKFVRAKYWSTLSCVKYGGACPVDGKWGPWTPWSSCSLKCGSGSRSRFRTCDSPQPAFAGHPCKGEFHHQQSCVMRDCGPASTETFTEWTKWTPCSISCGGYGVQKATRVCLRHAGCDLLGVLTPYVNRSRPCYTGDCPTQGGWSEWSDWTGCSAACGMGRQSRTRTCDSPFPAGGLYCIGSGTDFRLCKGQNCAGQPRPPVNTAYRKRLGQVDEDVMVERGDQYLLGPLNPYLESLYMPWSPWTRCSGTCGQGLRSRKRWCSARTTPMPPCEGEVQQVQFCNVFVCPVVGMWGVWLPWTPCSRTCGGGKRQRYRECNNPLPQYGGSCLGDAMKMEDCDIGPCPRMPGGTWSEWSPWSQCTVTCGGGSRNRKRARQRFSGPDTSGFNGPDQGSHETLDCNSQPCPVDGSWAEWGDWSRCSLPCGLGRRIRDRTCTDPSPLFGGFVCPGPGTDLVHCFAGPCKDAEDRAVYLGTTSWVRFAPHNRPSRFLVIYLHFKPMSPAGVLLRRYRQCRSVFDDDEKQEKESVEDPEDQKNSEEDRKADEDDKCQLVVNLSLEQAEVILSVLARGARVDIRSPATLSLGSWHEVLVEVLKSGASLRVNNHERLFSNFSRPLIKDLDFDSYMVLGAADNKTVGAVVSISSLSINFRTQDLYSSTDWQGQGTPVGRHAVAIQSINPSVQLPHFHGLYYSPLRLFHTERLTVRMTLALDGGEGLLLYCPGVATGTHVTLGVKQIRFVVCMLCSRGARQLCHHGDLLRLHQWYHVALVVEETEAELRVDQGKALQLTCKGLPFRPRKFLYVGGRSTAVWGDVQKATNYTDGFYGVLGTAVVNGRTVSFRRAVLMGREGRLNPDGYSRASRITPVFEHKNSIVILHCEVAQPADTTTDIKIVWLLRDTVLEPTAQMEIIKPVGLYRRVGTLQLKPGSHTEGIYACVVGRDGRLELRHVFTVFRHAATPELFAGRAEWVVLKILLILLPLLALGCILYKLRHWLIKLWNKLFGKTEPEEMPLLTSEPMEVWRGEKAHLHGQDAQTSWDNYLVQPGGSLVKEQVVTFGPSTTQELTLTPGVATDRPLQVSNFGQVRLGENPRIVSTDAGMPMEEVAGVEQMNPNAILRVEDPVYANMTHNRPRLVTCRQQHPITRGTSTAWDSKAARERTSASTCLSAPDRGQRGLRSRPSSQKDPRPWTPDHRPHSGAHAACAEYASMPQDSRSTKIGHRRSHSGDGRVSETPGDRERRRILSSQSRDRRELTRTPITEQQETARQRPHSEDRSHHHVIDPEVFFRASPPFNLRDYQQMRVRAPDPLVLGRGRQGHVGDSPRHRLVQACPHREEMSHDQRHEGDWRTHRSDQREGNMRR